MVGMNTFLTTLYVTMDEGASYHPERRLRIRHRELPWLCDAASIP